jgi:hypothetical protein
MEQEKKAHKVRGNPAGYIFLALLTFIFVLASVFLRGEYVSETLRSLIVPQLEKASGRRVTVEKMQINLLPLFIEAKELKVAGAGGRQIVVAGKVKGHVNLTGLLSRELQLGRLVIRHPVISADQSEIEEIASHIRQYLAKDEEAAVKLKLKVIEVQQGSGTLTEGPDAELSLDGLDAELILGSRERFSASLKEAKIRKKGWPQTSVGIDTAIVFDDDRIELKRLDMRSGGSSISGRGHYSRGEGFITTEMKLLVGTFKRLFGLSRHGEGMLSLRGEITLRHDAPSAPALWASGASKSDRRTVREVYVDLHASGDFYLETLMELLKVREKALAGHVDFEGDIKGPLQDFAANGTARLRNGILYGVDVDQLSCAVGYEDGQLIFKDGKAEVYGGSADAEALLHLPVIDFFEVKVKFTSADSKPVFGLIGWDPGIPAGKVEGELVSSGARFEPSGWFSYYAGGGRVSDAHASRETLGKESVLDRVRSVRGRYALKDRVLALSDLALETGSTSARVDGEVHLREKTLALNGNMTGGSIQDLTLPYYDGAKGTIGFAGTISGTFDNPRLAGKATSVDASIERYPARAISADFSYCKDLLSLKELTIRGAGEEHLLRGTIQFPQAEHLFDLSRPVYLLSGIARRADFGRFIRIFHAGFEGEGMMDGEFRIGSDEGINVSGKTSLAKMIIYGVPLDSASASFEYHKGRIILTHVRGGTGGSQFRGEGALEAGGKFSYRASSDSFISSTSA